MIDPAPQHFCQSQTALRAWLFTTRPLLRRNLVMVTVVAVTTAMLLQHHEVEARTALKQKRKRGKISAVILEQLYRVTGGRIGLLT